MNSVVKILETSANSINIRNDYTNIEKINFYYPNYKTLKLMSKILTLISSKQKGAFLLEGAYGTGKSFFTAILLNILSGNYSKKNYYNFLMKSNKIYNIENELKYFENKKYFVVFINDLVGEFTKDLSLAIYQSAKRENIVLNLSSDFEVIKERIKFWKNNYKNTYELFINKVNDIIGEERFFSLLDEKDEKSLIIFKDIYSDIFSGEKFISLEKIRHLDELLSEVEKQVIDLGYDGVIYTFDEFGRYLESNIEKIDVKEIQDMAEYCNANNSSNFLIITHKDIFYYGKKKRVKENYDEWSKVSGRFFKEVFLYEKFNTLEILQNILQKDNFDEYKKLHHVEFELKENMMKEIGIDDVSNKVDLYYPLDYFTALILPNFSQKFAQNERTLFSFICSEEANSLKSILKEDKTLFIGLDKIYDYFENSFKELNYEDNNYKLYLQSKNILSLLEKEEDILKSFVKTLTIIYIYNNFNELKPTSEVLSYLLNIENLDEIIKPLKEKNYIQYHKHNNYYKLVEDFDINIESEINDYISTKLNNFKYMEVLNRVIGKEYYYPLKYNDFYKINRYLGIYYLDVSEINDMEYIISNKQEDGKMIYLLNILDNPNYFTIKESLLNKEEYILINNKQGNKLDVLDSLKSLEAIRRIKIHDEKYITNNVFKLELEIYENEIINEIKSKLVSYFIKPTISINNREYSNLLECSFKYLKERYNKYFIINYELINKHNLTSQMKKARLDILNKIFIQERLEDSYFQGTTAENSLARILLYNTKAYSDMQFKIEESIYYPTYQDILKKIKQEKISVKKLYENFCSNESSYGLRKGIFTFIMGLVLIKNFEELSITYADSNTEVLNELSIIDKLEKSPEKYEIFYFPITVEQDNYLKLLEESFMIYLQTKEEKTYNKILAGIKNYLLSKPRFMTDIYLNEFKNLSKIFKGILGVNNGREFILTTIPKIYNSSNYVEVFEQFQNDIILFDSKKSLFIEELKKDIFAELGYDCDTFQECIKYIKEKDKVNEIENNILRLESLSEENCLIKFTEKLKGFSYENWRSFEEREAFLILLKEKIKSQEKNSISQESVKIFVDDQEREVILQKESPMGKILKLKLESVIKNMGVTVSEDEKKNILLKLLLEL